MYEEEAGTIKLITKGGEKTFRIMGKESDVGVCSLCDARIMDKEKKMEVDLIVGSNCPGCVSMKKKLNKLGIQFNEIKSHPMLMVYKSVPILLINSSVPVSKVTGEDLIGDIDIDILREVLNEKQQCPHLERSSRIRGVREL